MTAKGVSDSVGNRVERFTVNLILDSSWALEQLQERNGHKKVDIVNRALQIYNFIDEELKSGNSLYIVRPDGDSQRIKIL